MSPAWASRVDTGNPVFKTEMYLYAIWGEDGLCVELDGERSSWTRGV